MSLFTLETKMWPYFMTGSLTWLTLNVSPSSETYVIIQCVSEAWDISSLMLFSFERYNLLFWYYMCFKFYLKIYHINFIMRIFIVIDNLKNLILSMVRMIFSQISTSISIDLIHKINWIQYLSLHWRVIHCHM